MKSKTVIPLFAVAHFSHHLSTGVLSPLLPLLRQDMALNYFQAGVLVSALSLSYGLGQLPMALLADRFSERALVVIGLIGTALAAAAVSLTSTYWQMVPCFIALGLLGATYHAPVSSFLSQVVPRGRRGQSLGTHTIGGSASFLVTPVLAVAIASWLGAWRWSFLVLAVPTLVMGVVVWFATREPRRAGQGTAEGEAAAVRSSNPGGGPAQFSPHTVTWKEILTAVGTLALLSIVMQVVFSSVHSYLPLYLVDRHAISPEYAGIVVGLVAGAGVLGAPVGGAISDRLGRKWVILLSLALAGPLLFAALWAPANVLLPLSLAVYGVIVSARMPAMESLIADVVQPEKRATALGIYYLMGQETSGVITPLLGRLIDLSGPNSVFVTLAAGVCVVSVVALIFRKRI
jgi:FSR family fosmidomycin resistance protein-like MFS transporter